MRNDKVLGYVRKYKNIINRFYNPGQTENESFSKFKNFVSQNKKLSNVIKLEDYITRKHFVYTLCDLLDEEGFDKGSGIHIIMYEEVIRPVITRELRAVFSMPNEKSDEQKIEEELYFTNSMKIFNHLDIKNRTDWEDRYYYQEEGKYGLTKK